MTINEKIEILFLLVTEAALVWLFARAAFRTDTAMESTVDSMFWEGTLRHRYSEATVKLYGRILLAAAGLFLLVTVAQLTMGTFRWRGGARAYGFMDLLA